MKNRHNKKRNTAFLYEVLVKELTKAIIDEDNNRRQRVVALLKRHFNKSSILSRELQTYKSLCEVTQEEQKHLDKIVEEAYTTNKGLNKQHLNTAQAQLVNAIGKNLSKGVFLNFIPNYKELATISQFFNTPSPKRKVILEQRVKESVLKTPENKELKPTDKLTYKVFVNNFNKKYGTLLKEQQDLLSKYISSFATGDVDFKIFLNEEIGSIKDGLVSFLAEAKEKDVKEKVNEVLEVIESFKHSEVDNHLVGQVLRLQTLSKEIKNNEH